MFRVRCGGICLQETAWSWVVCAPEFRAPGSAVISRWLDTSAMTKPNSCVFHSVPHRSIHDHDKDQVLESLTLLCMLQHLEQSQSSHSMHFMEAGARVSQPSHLRGPGPISTWYFPLPVFFSWNSATVSRKILFWKCFLHTSERTQHSTNWAVLTKLPVQAFFLVLDFRFVTPSLMCTRCSGGTGCMKTQTCSNPNNLNLEGICEAELRTRFISRTWKWSENFWPPGKPWKWSPQNPRACEALKYEEITKMLFWPA